MANMNHNVRKSSFVQCTWIILSINAVWSESSLGTFWIAKAAKFLHVDKKDWSDCPDVRAGLSHRWAHVLEALFTEAVTHSYHLESLENLSLKAPSKICSRRHSNFLFYFSEKTSLDILCESSAKQTIHIKCQDLLSLKNKKTNKKLSSAAVVIGALRVNSVLFRSWQSV